MRAVLINDDKSLSLREVPNPVIKDDELLIKVMASGVNRFVAARGKLSVAGGVSGVDGT